MKKYYKVTMTKKIKLVDEDYTEVADYIDELMNKTDQTLNDNLEVTSSDEEE